MYCVWYRVIWYRNLSLPIVYVPYYITFWMKVFTSLRWIIRVTRAECPVLVSETTWCVCLLNPTLCLIIVWGLDPPGTSQVMAWQTIKHIHLRTHKAHHLCSWGYRQLSYLFHSVFRSTLKNSSTLCIYGLVQVETSGKQWFPHRRLSMREACLC